MIEPRKICVLGSVNLDLIIKTKTLPKAGETIGGGRYTSLPGGKGANIALAAQRLGAVVELRACVGRDAYADQSLKNLVDANVRLKKLITKDIHTGLAFINVADDGENQIAVAAGANGEFLPNDLTPINADALISQFEIPPQTVLAALQGFEGFVCLNASPVVPDLARFLPYTDLVIVNEPEHIAYNKTLWDFEGPVAVTQGSKGAVLIKNGREIARAFPPKVKVVDTTGAGDAFAAALTLGLIEGQTAQQALEFACRVGAYTTRQIGAQDASPARSELN